MDSGDLAYLDRGEVFFTGRRKECIIHEGRNLSPHDIEVAAAEAPGVQAGGAVAIGVPDPHAGTERIVVIAETLAYRAADLAHVKTGLKRKLADAFALDVEVELVPVGSIPRTSNGKVRRGSARALYVQGKLRVARRPLWRQIVSLWRGALLPGTLRGARAAGHTFQDWSRIALDVSNCAGAGVAARFGVASGLTTAARGLVAVEGAAETHKPGIYVVNRISEADAWAVIAFFGGRCSFSGDAALLEMGWSARWALEPLIAAPEVALAARRPLVVFPESAFERVTARCRYRLDAFKAAIAEGAPLFPLALVRGGNGLRGIIGEPIAPEKGESAAALRERTRAALAALAEGDSHA
jgi:hypothetical protein